MEYESQLNESKRSQEEEEDYQYACQLQSQLNGEADDLTNVLPNPDVLLDPDEVALPDPEYLTDLLPDPDDVIGSRPVDVTASMRQKRLQYFGSSAAGRPLASCPR